MVINTVEASRNAIADSRSIRTTAVQARLPYFTTVAGARAACVGMRHLQSLTPYDLQGLHRRLKAA
jgi:carbamoyl-phosphate synthase large subunit